MEKIEKGDIVAFFDNAAAGWDADLIRNEEVIRKILDNAGVSAGKRILDIACGTGVLIPDYLSRGVKSVTGVDISPEMVKLAREKFPQENVKILCADAESLKGQGEYDCVMVYNAFPHFPDPDKLINVLSGLLAPGGTLTVAHGRSRASIDAHHTGAAAHVSVGLMHEDDLAAIFEKHVKVIVKISDGRMYQVTGIKE